ncbi:hypothetical protein GCM10023187_42990 [Nibrella viscosa]|uniref:Chemotaxis methyl-accepting receptor HlyB-like 4HB MCP domain-containing protein n=1 Tax=Nibrella viscosa TaxID=1084524 RepID=A0ABP8KRQ4_9BACT
MKWSFVIQQKIKAALLLTGIMVFVTLNTVISRSNIRGIDKSFSSIYQDRLLPAVDLVYLSENLYNKRLLLEEHLMAGNRLTPTQIRGQLSHYNARIDSLIRKVEETYLIQKESESLQAFKQSVQTYAGMEQRMLSLSETGQTAARNKLYTTDSAVPFRSAIRHLNELTNIQSEVGRQLMKESHSESAMVDLIATLQIALAIITGALILGLIHSSSIIKQNPRSFPLN